MPRLINLVKLKIIPLFITSIYLFLFLSSMGASPVTRFLPLYTLITLIFFALIAYLLTNFSNEKNFKTILVSILVIAFIIRLLVVIYLPTRPVSDFKYYFENAQAIANGLFVGGKNIGYSLLISLGLRIFNNLISAKIVNLGFGVLSVYLVFLILKQWASIKVALMASFVFSIFPSEILMTGVIGTETIITSLYLLLAYTTTKFVLSKRIKPSLVWITITGLVFSLSFTVRSYSIIYTVLIVFIVFYKQSENFRARIFISLVFLISCLMGLFIIALLITGDFRRSNLSIFSAQDNLPILTGTNIETGGYWNVEDSSFYYSYPENDRKSQAIRTALQRIVNDPYAYLLFAVEKIEKFMGTNAYPVDWAILPTNWQDLTTNSGFTWERTISPTLLSNTTIQRTMLILQSSYVAIWFCCVLTVLRNPSEKIVFIVAVITLVSIFPHVILEVQGRYHHYIMPFEIICASLSFFISSHNQPGVNQQLSHNIGRLDEN